jgi:hypothetical protein
LGLLLSGTLPAHGGSWTDAQLGMATKVEMMKGHLRSALEDYRIGEIPLAQAHVGHALHEEYEAIAPTLGKARPALNKTLREALTRLQQGGGDQRDAATYGKEVESAFRVPDQALEALIPADVRKAPSFWAAVLAHLIEEVGEEYGEAVQDGKLVNLPEYQDAFGFLQRAKAVTKTLPDAFVGNDRQRLQSLLRSLEEAIPGIMPPSTPATSEAVRKHADGLVELLRKRAGD